MFHIKSKTDWSKFLFEGLLTDCSWTKCSVDFTKCIILVYLYDSEYLSEGVILYICDIINRTLCIVYKV